MHIVVTGLNYRTAPVEIREQFAISEEDLPRALQQLKQTRSILECVIVATCNRTEIYAVVDRLHLCSRYIRGFFEDWFGVPADEFSRHLYKYSDDEAVEHLFKVASGLDSMILGETQILGQVKKAFMLAQRHQMTETLLNTLFRRAVTMAKRAHAGTGIGEHAVSVSYAAVELAKHALGELQGKKVLLVGAGKTGELTLQHLRTSGADEVIVVNRTVSKADELVRKLGGTPCSFDDLPMHLADASAVISSTGSEGYVLTRQMTEKARAGMRRPLIAIDIAVPRDLDPAIADLPAVTLYDIDDMQHIIRENMDQRRLAAEQIRTMIEDEVDDFYGWFRTLGVGPVIRALQDKAASIHEDTMQSLLNKLPDLSEREIKVIRKLTKSMVNQMTHDPISGIKELSARDNSREALESFTKLFGLEDWVKDAGRDAEDTAAPGKLAEFRGRDDEKDGKSSCRTWEAVAGS